MQKVYDCASHGTYGMVHMEAQHVQNAFSSSYRKQSMFYVL